jgi:hypothetical protein
MTSENAKPLILACLACQRIPTWRSHGEGNPKHEILNNIKAQNTNDKKREAPLTVQAE